tara:strand:- start:2877 stop:3050 length:174 start_codon:yes stop_codon:yes gene_type:complete
MKIYKNFPVYGGLTKREYGKTIQKNIRILESQGITGSKALKIAKQNTKKLYKLPLVR